MAAYVGHAPVPTVAGPVEIEWSLDALADLNRFAAFLHGQFPELAARVAGELIARADVLRRHPKLGRPIGNRAGDAWMTFFPSRRPRSSVAAIIGAFECVPEAVFIVLVHSSSIRRAGS